MIRVMAAGTGPAAAGTEYLHVCRDAPAPDRLRPLIPGARSPRHDRQAACGPGMDGGDDFDETYLAVAGLVSDRAAER
jgi:hypothetical protein